MWSIDSCQKRVSANQYQLDRIAGSGIDPSTSSIFCGYPLTSYKFSDDRRLKFNFFKFMSCTNKILISNWPRTRKFSQFLQVGKAFALDVERDQRVTMVSQISILWLVKIWQVSSCGKFMQHLETCLLIAVDLPTSRAQIFSRARSVSGRRFMFSEKVYDSWSWQSFVSSCDVINCLFHCMYKMKYSCFQDSSVIHDWSVYWVISWEIRCLSKSLEIRFRLA